MSKRNLLASLEIRFAHLQEAVQDHVQKMNDILRLPPSRGNDLIIGESVEDLRWALEETAKESK